MMEAPAGLPHPLEKALPFPLSHILYMVLKRTSLIWRKEDISILG
jgi:hypothetical protein